MVVFTRNAAGFVFLCATLTLAGAMLRWQWHGVLWTAGGVLAAYTGLGTAAAQPVHVAIQGLGLPMVAILLGCIGAYEARVRDEIFRLVAWPRALSREAPALIRDLLKHPTEVLDAPRVLMGWGKPEDFGSIWHRSLAASFYATGSRRERSSHWLRSPSLAPTSSARMLAPPS